MPARSTFKTGAVIPESGVYRVIHSAHRLPHDVTLFRGGKFPRCCKCADQVVFELLHAAPAFVYQPMHIFELPIVDDEQPPTAEAL